jgi:hypothetical protein
MRRLALSLIATLGHPRPVRNAFTRLSASLLIGLLACPGLSAVAELKPSALRGFDRYVQLTERRIAREVRPGPTFLWLDSLPGPRLEQAQEQLRRGELAIQTMRAPSPAAGTSTPGALIHHWMGTILIPGATLAAVFAILQNYDRHQVYFRPEVVQSRTLRHEGDDFTVSLRLKRSKVITVVFDTEHQVHYHHLDATHAYSESRSTRIKELFDPGGTDERPLPPGEDHGFLWRLNSYWRFLETDEGVYVQCEAVSLTRDIPTGLGWLVGPFVERIPRESLQFTLESLRAAVPSSPQK